MPTAPASSGSSFTERGGAEWRLGREWPKTKETNRIHRCGRCNKSDGVSCPSEEGSKPRSRLCDRGARFLLAHDLADLGRGDADHLRGFVAMRRVCGDQQAQTAVTAPNSAANFG